MIDWLIDAFKPYSNYVIHIETSQWTTNGCKIYHSAQRWSLWAGQNPYHAIYMHRRLFSRLFQKFTHVFDSFQFFLITFPLYYIMLYFSKWESGGLHVGLQQFGNNFSLGIVMYPYVITNTGNGYDTKTGKFTSPRKGT